jgi:AAHS family 4-hydroxybenzoate transporter-like MFS transporter
MMLVEGFDLAAMPLVVPLASADWGISPARFAWSLSAVIVGIGVGAVSLAPLGDRFGRRSVIITTAGALTLVTLGTSMATSPGAFTAWRLLTGLALGACLPNTTALAAGIAPARLRARILTLVMAAVPVGSVIAGLSAGWLEGIGGWPSFFVVAAVATLAAATAFAFVLPADEPAPRDARTRSSSVLPVLQPLQLPHRRATLALLALGTCNTFLIYMLISWLPTLLPRVGVSVATAAKLSTLVQVGGLAGGLAYSWFIDLGYARRTFLVGYTLAIVALALLATNPGATVSAGLLLLVGIGISGAHTTITIYGIGFFPAAMVSSFLGLSIAVTRAGAILGPLAGGRLVAQGEGLSAFMIAAAAVAVLCFACVLTVPHKRQISRAADVNPPARRANKELPR